MLNEIQGQPQIQTSSPPESPPTSRPFFHVSKSRVNRTFGKRAWRRSKNKTDRETERQRNRKRRKKKEEYIICRHNHGRGTNQRPMPSIIHWDGKRRSPSTLVSSSSLFFLFRCRRISLPFSSSSSSFSSFSSSSSSSSFSSSSLLLLSIASIIYRPKMCADRFCWM